MLIAFALLTAPLAAQASAPAIVQIADKTYAVIFEVTTDAAGAVANVTVSKVIDPDSGNTDAVEVAVPDAYIAVARLQIERKAKEKLAPSKTYYTYFFYDPRTPDILKTR